MFTLSFSGARREQRQPLGQGRYEEMGEKGIGRTALTQTVVGMILGQAGWVVSLDGQEMRKPKKGNTLTGTQRS